MVPPTVASAVTLSPVPEALVRLTVSVIVAVLFMVVTPDKFTAPVLLIWMACAVVLEPM